MKNLQKKLKAIKKVNSQFISLFTILTPINLKV